MTTHDDDSPGLIRRVSRRDRKRKLETRAPLFPPEDDDPAGQEPAPPPPAAPPAERFPPLPERPPKRRPASERAPARPPRSGRACLPNLVALFFLAATLVAIAVFGIIWVDPYTPLNPFPPFTPLPIFVTTTPLPESAPPPAPPTATPAAPTATFTPLAVVSPAPGAYPFRLDPAGIVYAPNGNGQGCAWSSIAGAVTGADGAPLAGYGVRVTGAGRTDTVFSGSAGTFGAGGYELFLNSAPLEMAYTVQLLDPQGTPASEAYPVVTLAACESNVAIVNFVAAP